MEKKWHLTNEDERKIKFALHKELDLTPQPHFTLSTEEVEIVRYHFAHKQKALDSLLHNMEFDDERDTDEYIRWKCQFKEISYILNRIKQWQDENRNN